MYKAIIIDDEPLAIMMVEEYLKGFPDITVMDTCNDGFAGLKAIATHQPDLVFLDVQMPKITGFEMLELIDHPPAIIFTTAFEEYAVKAFEAHAIDYLLKPYTRERFEKAVNKFLQQAQKEKAAVNLQELLESNPVAAAQPNRIVVRNGQVIKIIPVDEVIYLEAADDYTRIVTKEASFLKKKTMASFEVQLDPNRFTRIHRSYILNLQELTRLDAHEKDSYLVTLRNGHKLPVSKTGYTKLKSVLGI
ncbi:LytTR family DNA-binding domain-containing protein [Flavihumibacter rivuli]|uniref:LytR/AlgR family response regulator transcription factor n=1 Tax=Flavihumibacter rivuli TaxID=2838156 RepID=UPI001BDF6324|nr:LytTR family DNA-binding domain-containing protein [Flavihumibacter rivuli]ULQ54928.1 LytTR family DNA-binding domain-containing protein [Flavihumibacter rivuli]